MKIEILKEAIEVLDYWNVEIQNLRYVYGSIEI